MLSKLPLIDYLKVKSLFYFHSSSAENNSDSLSSSALFSDYLADIFLSNL